jgi:rSAM/selenodomain-associated transferase 1
MNTLVVMAKHPLAGTVKTRLATSLGHTAAAGLAAAFLRDLLNRLHPCADRHVLATSPDNPAATSYFKQLSEDRFELWNQPEGSLGERLARVTSDHLGPLPHDRVVVIGSDSPTLPKLTIEEAFGVLEQTDVVVAPADDGGYVLIGVRREVPGLFEAIEWSSPRVFAQTRQHLQSSSTPFIELPGWYDIDTLDDLRRLDNELGPEHPLGRAGGATRERLDELPQGWDFRSIDG